jgi:hypothetical protein
MWLSYCYCLVLFNLLDALKITLFRGWGWGGGLKQFGWADFETINQ